MRLYVLLCVFCPKTNGNAWRLPTTLGLFIHLTMHYRG